MRRYRWMSVPLLLTQSIVSLGLFAADADWLKAPALRPGDAIAFVAPAGPGKPEMLEVYAKRLRQAGFQVLIPKDIDRQAGYLAGSDEQRAAELNAMLRDPQVKAIFPCRGGFGLTRILDRIDYDALRRQPKIITGYSDLTALHLAIARRAKVITFHAPMPMFDLWKCDQEPFVFAAQSFERTVFARQYPPGQIGYAVATPTIMPPTKLVGGRAAGRLLGGNLSLITATIGTPYAIEPTAAILFLEDVHEAPYRIDRMLSQLRLAGVLDAVAGVVLGGFTVKDETQVPDIDRVLREYFAHAKVPVVMQYPVGHIPHNATLPHGARVELDADHASLRVLENPVRLD